MPSGLEIRFGPKIGQIGSKWDKPGTFSDQIWLAESKCTEIWSENVPDLSYLGLMWPTWKINQKSLESDVKTAPLTSEEGFRWDHLFISLKGDRMCIIICLHFRLGRTSGYANFEWNNARKQDEVSIRKKSVNNFPRNSTIIKLLFLCKWLNCWQKIEISVLVVNNVYSNRHYR